MLETKSKQVDSSAGDAWPISPDGIWPVVLFDPSTGQLAELGKKGPLSPPLFDWVAVLFHGSIWRAIPVCLPNLLVCEKRVCFMISVLDFK